MSNDLDFINQLAENHVAVSPLASAEKRSLIWITGHTLVIALIMYLIQPFRSTWDLDVKNVHLMIELASFVVAIISLTYFSFLSVVPGSIAQSKYKFALIPFVILLGSLLSSIAFPHQVYPRSGARSTCELEIMIYSIAPIMHILYLLKKGFFVDKKTSFVMATAASATIPAFLMHMACAYNATHIVLFHITPILLMVGAGTYFAMRKSKS